MAKLGATSTKCMLATRSNGIVSQLGIFIQTPDWEKNQLLVTFQYVVFQSGGFGRLHIFSTDRRDEILKKIEDNAKKYIGIAISAKKVSITLQKAMETRLGKYRQVLRGNHGL